MEYNEINSNSFKVTWNIREIEKILHDYGHGQNFEGFFFKFTKRYDKFKG